MTSGKQLPKTNLWVIHVVSTKIEAMVGLRREQKPRGRPKKQKENEPEENLNQGKLPF
ncbi:MAG: hypothetical protein ABFS56_33440 [Pseudomonadota bacterium]